MKEYEYIKNDFYDDKVDQVKMIALNPPHEILAECLGVKYIEYRNKWVETSRCNAGGGGGQQNFHIR
jgi:hypothetical protein